MNKKKEGLIITQPDHIGKSSSLSLYDYDGTNKWFGSSDVSVVPCGDK